VAGLVEVLVWRRTAGTRQMRSRVMREGMKGKIGIGQLAFYGRE
jgi:hypothetical protein